MTRKQRMIAIIDNFGGRNGHTMHLHIAGVMSDHGLNAFTETALEDLARSLLMGRRMQQRLNRENRAIAKRRAA